MLLRRYMNGKIKPPEYQNVHCPMCNDGKDFEKEEHIRKREFGSKTHQMSCEGCDSKYIIPTKPAKFVTGSYCNDCPYLDGTTCTQQQSNFLCKGRIPSLLNEFNELQEGLKMNQELMQKREQFQKTHQCPGHRWITSQPFTTAEGTFEIENCLICGLAKINYKGVEYEDNMMKIVSFLASQGINKLRAEKEIIKKQNALFRDIGLDKIERTPTIRVSELFNIAPESPKIEFKL